MSYSTWITYGYGIVVDKIETTPEKLEALLALAPGYKEKVYDWFKEIGVTKPTLEDYIDFGDQDNYLGLAIILREVIAEAEGIILAACDDCNSTIYLLFARAYPWWLKEKEKNLTEEDIQALFGKYVRILTDTPIEVDYEAVENGG